MENGVSTNTSSIGNARGATNLSGKVKLDTKTGFQKRQK
jgi:hypothetical protein